jgi:hypothetical protein
MTTDKTGYSKPVKQEVNSTVILPPLVFPELIIALVGGKAFHLSLIFGSSSPKAQKLVCAVDDFIKLLGVI